jgi:hypothetical protein
VRVVQALDLKGPDATLLNCRVVYPQPGCRVERAISPSDYTAANSENNCCDVQTERRLGVADDVGRGRTRSQLTEGVFWLLSRDSI